MFTVRLWGIICFQLVVGVSSTTPVCNIPAGHRDGEEVSMVPEPKRGNICTLVDTVIITRRQCERRYCCTHGCTCDDQIYENEPACYDQNQNSDAVELQCFLEQNTTRQLRYICCDGYSEDEDGVCVQMLNCDIHNGYCSHNCSITNDTYHEPFPGLHVFSYGSYICSCLQGYILQSNNYTCLDIDECTDSSASPCAHICNNTAGSFVCSCREGYQLSSDEVSCNDINECTPPNGNCQQGCSNYYGNYSCYCYVGYRGRTTDNYTCSDINECTENGSRLCQDECRNTPGSYACFCKVGFQLGPDRMSCSDIDECAQNNGDCEQWCKNTVGSHSCSCDTEYVLRDDNRTCGSTASTLTPITTESIQEEQPEEEVGEPMAAKSSSRTVYLSYMPLYIGVPLLIVGVLSVAVLLLHRIQARHNKISAYADVTAASTDVDEDDDGDNDDTRATNETPDDSADR